MTLRADVDGYWDRLLALGVSDQTLHIVTNINGYSIGTMEAILYAHTGYESFDQFDDEQEDDE